MIFILACTKCGHNCCHRATNFSSPPPLSFSLFCVFSRSHSRAFARVVTIFRVAQRFRGFSLYEPLSIVDIFRPRALRSVQRPAVPVCLLHSVSTHSALDLATCALSSFRFLYLFPFLQHAVTKRNVFVLVQLRKNRYEIII